MIRTGKKNCVRTGCLIVYIHMNKFTTFTTSSVLFCFCFVIDIYIYVCIYRGTRNDWFGCPSTMIALRAPAQWLLWVLRHNDCFVCSGTTIALIERSIRWPACSSTRLKHTKVETSCAVRWMHVLTYLKWDCQDVRTSKNMISRWNEVLLCFEYTCPWNETVALRMIEWSFGSSWLSWIYTSPLFRYFFPPLIILIV